MNKTFNDEIMSFKKLSLEELEKKLPFELRPKHIGIIMDGNGRWAKKRGVPRKEGHKAGGQAVEKIIDACLHFQIPILTLYAFSTENWKRSKQEVDSLMDLLQEYSEKYLPTVEEKNVRFQLLGDFSLIESKIRKNLFSIQKRTREKNAMVLCMAINYGGRDEIVRATKKIIQDSAKQKKLAEDLNDELFSSYLDTKGLPDVDLLIRTSGEQRISNFLLWQSAYAEFYFCKTLWPEFDENELFLALVEFSKRNRTRGRR